MIVIGPASFVFFFFFNDTATTEIYTLSLHDALPISPHPRARRVEPDHRARIGAMHRDGLARRKCDVGEEALVAFDQRCGNERGREAHVSDLARSVLTVH